MRSRKYCTTALTGADESLQVITRGIVAPFTNEPPHRPLRLVFDGELLAPVVSEVAELLDREGMGITCVQHNPNPIPIDLSKLDFQPSPYYRICTHCRHLTHNPIKCGGCGAVLYCSRQCMCLDWSRYHLGNLYKLIHRRDHDNHIIFCGKMAKYMERDTELSDFPFTFTPETTCLPFDMSSFLKKRGLHGYDHW